MPKLPHVSGKKLLRFLERQGFTLHHINGSHHLMRKGAIQTVVPVHGNRDLKTGTLRGILRDIEMAPEELERLWKKQ